MFSAYRTLAATARILGVSENRVVEMIDRGPLVARVFGDGRRMVHDDDLRAFRRPLFFCPDSQSPIISAKSTGYTKDDTNNQSVASAQPLATGQTHEVAERWAPVVGSDRHEVSTLGRLRSWRFLKRKERLTSPIEVKPRAISEGYLGFGKQSRLHTAVLEAFVGPCPEGHECAHRNGDKHDNRLENLRWATHAENIKDKAAHAVPYVRRCRDLDDDEIAELIRRREAGEGRGGVASAFGVTPQTVSRHTRRHLAVVR